jgi:CubicO group peptidase (beta-lactamase class C family)
MKRLFMTSFMGLTVLIPPFLFGCQKTQDPKETVEDTTPIDTVAQNTVTESSAEITDVSTIKPSAKPEDLSSLDALAKDILQEHALVGLAISTYQYGADDELMINKAVAGSREMGGDQPVTLNDKWHIGSCTKAMTALLFIDSVKNTDVTLGASIAEIFKDHVDVIDPAWNDIAMRDVFSHRAGIKDFGAGWMMKRIFDDSPMRSQRLDMVALLLAKPPELAVGEFQYSNMGYIMAGSAVEVITDKPWEQAMKDGLLGQIMGQDGWGFGPPQGDEPQGHRKSLFKKKLKPAGQEWTGADNPKVLGPAGTVHAQHDVWAQFALAFLPGQTAIDNFDKAYVLMTPEDEDYALGWGVSEKEGFGKIYSHAGSNTMWLSQVIIVPEKRAVVLVSTNTPPEKADKAVRQASREAMNRLQ